jgi:hypothetical protein
MDVRIRKSRFWRRQFRVISCFLLSTPVTRLLAQSSCLEPPFSPPATTEPEWVAPGVSSEITPSVGCGFMPDLSGACVAVHGGTIGTEVSGYRSEAQDGSQGLWDESIVGGSFAVGMSAPVLLRNGDASTFVYLEDAESALNTLTGDTSWRVDLATLGECQNPAFPVPAPVIQLKRLSNDAFQSQDDLVFQIAGSSCLSDHAHRLYALHASDGSVAWTFNEFGTALMNAGQGCTVDYPTNTLLCTTRSGPIGALFRTIWAFDTATGNLKWGSNVGPLSSDLGPDDQGPAPPAPQVGYGGQHVYVATSTDTANLVDRSSEELSASNFRRRRRRSDRVTPSWLADGWRSFASRFRCSTGTECRRESLRI